MGVCAGQTGAKLALLSRLRATSGATNCQRLFLGDFHCDMMQRRGAGRMVNFDQCSEDSSASPLREEPILSLDDLHRSRALLVIIRHMIDTTAYRVAPHFAGVVGLHEFRDDLHVSHSRIEPQVVAVRIEDDRHPVVDGRRHLVRGRCQDRACLDDLAACVPPAVP